MTCEDRKYESARILLQVSRAVSSSLEIEKVTDLVLAESSRLLGSDHASLFLEDDNSKRMMLAKAIGFSSDQLENINLLGMLEAINDDVLGKNVSVLVNDIMESRIFKDKKLPFTGLDLPVHSFLAVPLESEGKVIGVLIVSNKKRAGHIFDAEDEKLIQTLSNNMAASLLNARLYRRLKSLFISTVTSLTRAIDAKDAYTSGHSERVMRYSVAIGREMGLPEEAMENLRLSSLLHDVGKIGVKESILMKPAKLLGYERRQVMLHPGIGARIIESIDDSHKIIRGVMEHHERFDGKGYPKHLKGESISMEGRIIAVADTFDALTTDRPYHKKYSRDGALAKIQEVSSAQFDPEVVAAFIASLKRHPEIWSR